MSTAESVIRKVGGPAVPALGRALLRAQGNLAGELIANRLDEQPNLRAGYEAMTDEHARLHFGDEEIVDQEHLRRAMRLFHAWRVEVLRERIGAAGLERSRFLDVGDTDGLMLKHLGQPGLGFNLAPAAVHNIESNGIEARLGDGHRMPFEDGEFDHVLCFETLEHVESPHDLLGELARVCSPEGRVWLSIPWVPRTFVYPRDEGVQRGYMHVFEFSREDFGSLVSHSPLEIRFDTVCDIVGRSPHRAPARLPAREPPQPHPRGHLPPLPVLRAGAAIGSVTLGRGPATS